MRISSNKLRLAARCSTRMEDKATDCAEGQRDCNANAWTFFHVWPLKWLPRVSLTFEQIQLRQLLHGQKDRSQLLGANLPRRWARVTAPRTRHQQ